MYCKYCGKQMDDDAAYCSACGRASSLPGSVKPSGTRSKAKIVAIIIFALCVGVLIIFAVYSKRSAELRLAEEAAIAASIAESEAIAESIAEAEAIAESIAEAEAIAESVALEESRNQYLDKLNSFASIAEDGIGATEGICSFYCLVWYNTMFEEHNELTDPYTMTNGAFHTDVQDSFDAASRSLDLRATITNAESCKELMTGLIKELSDPPADLVECYKAAKVLLDAYLDLFAHAQGPYGNLATYADNYDKYSAELNKAYRKFCAMIPES